MFTSRYYPNSAYAPRYFPKLGAALVVVPIVPIALTGSARPRELTNDARPRDLASAARSRNLTCTEDWP